jgi:hypothetical protein
MDSYVLISETPSRVRMAGGGPLAVACDEEQTKDEMMESLRIGLLEDLADVSLRECCGLRLDMSR